MQVEIKYLIYHVNSHDNFIEGSYKYFGVSSSQFVTTLISLVTIGVGIVKIFLVCHVTPLNHICLKGCVNLWMEAPHGNASGDKVFNLSRDHTKPYDRRIM